ncbi:hypothetical protein [Marinoscillum sp.]
MDKEANQLLKQVIANQVVIFKRLDQIENKLKIQVVQHLYLPT